ncbi:54S ribosomal protein L7, mitochondrial [Savitreella phatthalungensis]
MLNSGAARFNLLSRPVTLAKTATSSRPCLACRGLTTKQILSKRPPLPASWPDSIHYEPRELFRPRYEEFYHEVLAQDLMTMQFDCELPGEEKPRRQNEIRTWDGSSPYHKNRSNRPLRGKKVFKPLPEKRTFANIPKVESVFVHTMVKEAVLDKTKLSSVYMALQAMTGRKPEVLEAKTSVNPWKLREGQPVALQVKLTGSAATDFLGTVVESVLPQLKDFSGLPASTGDGTGNIAFGLPKEAMSRFNEIEANYENYTLLQGFHIIINTSATNDNDAKQLVSGLGFPFQRK